MCDPKEKNSKQKTILIENIFSEKLIIILLFLLACSMVLCNLWILISTVIKEGHSGNGLTT